MCFDRAVIGFVPAMFCLTSVLENASTHIFMKKRRKRLQIPAKYITHVGIIHTEFRCTGKTCIFIS